MYILKASTISYQPTFGIVGFSDHLPDIDDASHLMHPDYLKLIPPMEARRMSDVIKMAVACSKNCIPEDLTNKIDAIAVGTALGSIYHTENFQEKIYESKGEIIAPTSFILSTHNTIAGQISLALKNHGYNNTHTQNSLSFEHALIDGVMNLEEGAKFVLVGASDEANSVFFNTKERLKNESINVTFGASFFLLAADKPDVDAVQIVNTVCSANCKDIFPEINEFLSANECEFKDIDYILYSSFEGEKVNKLKSLFKNAEFLHLDTKTGTYLTNSAFATHIGYDMLIKEGSTLSNVLILNNLIPKNLGLTLLKKVP
ncbi:MAG: hypothetical protein RI883_1475 [Bacteroidota bacterium]|jgi:hypothetical protein